MSDYCLDRYSSYDNSDAEWIGLFPASWLKTRLGYHIDFMTGFAFKSEGFSFDMGVKLVRGDNVTEGKLRWGEKSRFWPEITANIQEYALQEGDIVVGMDGSKVGKNFAMIRDADLPLLLVQRVACLRARDSISRNYLLHLVGSNLFRVWTTLVKTDPAIPHISPDNIKKFPLVLPTFSEQTQIAKFLDYETAKIDALIDKQQQLIALLKEKRQAVISHAVTKGLNPDAPMRDSGVEWLGEVPAHWTVSQLKHNALHMQTGPFGSQLHAEDYVEGGIPLINPVHIVDGRIIPESNCSVDNETYKRLVRHKLSIGDIIFARRGEMGRCAVVQKAQDGWLCGSGSLRTTLLKKLVPEYAVMLISSNSVKAELSLASRGSTMENLNTDTLGRLRLPVPPRNEQLAILTHVEQVSGRYDRLERLAVHQSDLLQERRTALISAAVTGKIDVRSWQLPASETSRRSAADVAS